MSLFRKLASLAATTFLFLSIGASATPIVYEFSGTVSSGSLNGAGFTNRAFTVDVFGDTSGVVSGGPGLLYNAATSVTFSIAGIGNGTLLDAYRMFLTSSAVGFSHLPDENDLIDVLGGVFTGYALGQCIWPHYYRVEFY